MPRVLLDLRMVQGPLHGIARYALELARRLPRLAPGWEFKALVPPEGLPSTLGSLRPDLSEIRARARYLSPLEQADLAATLLRTNLDLFHATSFSLPALWPGPLVATLHDANHLALPRNYGVAQQAYYRAVVGPRARTAKALITISSFSRDELSRYLKLNAFKLQVIPQGVDERFAPQPASQISAFRRRLNLPPRFLLAMGNPKPHKNLELLAKLAEGLPIPIVLLAGRNTGKKLGFPASTVDLGELPEEDLPLLYAAAEALLFPSRYEGFGLPPLEAMACGCPVLAANTSSLPEVCGDAALLLDPDSEHAWREAIFRLCRTPAVRRELSEKGLERATRFTWDDCARRTLAVYARVLDAA